MAASRQNPHYGETVKWNEQEAFVGVPPFCYMHTLDQLKMMIGDSGLEGMLHRQGIDELGPREKIRDFLTLINVGTVTEPEWRCDHVELKRWMRRKKIPVYNI